MNKTKWTYFFCLFTLLVHSNLHSQELTAYTEILVPYQQYDEDENIVGMSVDIVKALAAVSSDTVDIRIMPWARSYNLALKTKNTLIFSIARTPERESTFLWVGSVAQHQSYIWGLKKKFSKNALSKEQLEKVSFAVARGSHGHKILRESNHENVVTAVYERQVVDLVHRERADVFMMSRYTLKSLAQDLDINFDDFVPVHKRKKTLSNLYIAFSPGSDTELVKNYRQAYQLLRQNGTLREIRQKWGLESSK